MVRPGIRVAFEKRLDLFVEVDGIARSDGRVAPSVILDQLASVCAEASQIRIVSIQNPRRFFICKSDIAVEVNRAPVPLRIFEYGSGEVAVCERGLHRT